MIGKSSWSEPIIPFQYLAEEIWDALFCDSFSFVLCL